MLQAIRDKATGWIAWVIVILLSVPFALFGIQQYFEGGGGDAVALVDGEELPLRQYSREYQNALGQLARQRDGQVSEQQEQALKEQVLNQLIERHLMARIIDEAGYGISAGQLEQAVKRDPQFQEDGRYSKQRLEQALRYWGLSEAGFAAEMNQRMRLSQLESGVQANAPVTDRQLDDFLTLDGQTRDFDRISLKTEAFREKARLETGAVEAYFEANRDEFEAPEQVRVEYLDLDADALAEGHEPDAVEIAAWYEQHKDQFRSREQRRAAHILITVSTDADEDTRKQARERMSDLEKQLREGAEFADLAKAHSMDSGTAAEGGDLGFVAEGDLDESVMEAVGRLQPGEISEPVRSTYGWHLVKVTEINGGEVAPLAEVREQVQEKMRLEAGEGRFYELGEILANNTYEFSNSLQPAADAMELPIEISAWFHAQGLVDPEASPEDIADMEAVRAAAFSEEVLKDRVNSQVIRVGDRRALVVRVLDRKPPRVRSLEEVRDEIETRLVEEQASALLRAKADEIRQAIESGTEPEAAAQAAGAEFETYTEMKRTEFNLPFTVLKEVFRLPRPAEGTRRVSAVEGENGAYHVVILKKVDEADLAAITDEERALFRRTLGQFKGRTQFEAYLNYLRENAEIQIFRDRL